MKTTNYLLGIAISIFFITSCKKEQSSVTALNGTWQSIGYGKILTITNTDYQFYETTSISCLPIHKGLVKDIKDIIVLNNDTLTFNEGINRYQYAKRHALPNFCNISVSETQNKNTLFNFEVFAETFKTHHAYFELNTTNWDSIYKLTKSKITANTSEAELFYYMENMRVYLNDNHSYLDASDHIMEAAEQLKTPEPESTHKWLGDFGVSNVVANHHLIDNLTRHFNIINWGKFNDTIGYIQPKAMFMHADVTLNDSLQKAEGFSSAYYDALSSFPLHVQLDMEKNGMARKMDTIMNDLKQMKAIILDVRFNGGGHDMVSLEIMKYFNATRHQIVTKKTKLKNGFTKNLSVFLEASENAYTKPLYILTSQQTGSAAEMLVMSSLNLQQVTRIGMSTEGATSDAFERSLPNGWWFSLSNEIYQDTKGISYENIGVPPDITLHYPEDRQTFFRSVVNDLDADKQTILMALQH